jgi:hypothetical protein
LQLRCERDLRLRRNFFLELDCGVAASIVDSVLSRSEPLLGRRWWPASAAADLASLRDERSAVPVSRIISAAALKRLGDVAMFVDEADGDEMEVANDAEGEGERLKLVDAAPRCA